MVFNEVRQKWNETYDLRKNCCKDWALPKIIESFPALSLPEGYILVCFNFSFVQNWNNGLKIVEF